MKNGGQKTGGNTAWTKILGEGRSLIRIKEFYRKYWVKLNIIPKNIKTTTQSIKQSSKAHKKRRTEAAQNEGHLGGSVRWVSQLFVSAKVMFLRLWG